MRKAFTMAELLIVMAVIGLMASFAIPKYQSHQFHKSLNETMEQIQKIIYNGIIDPVTGYANGSGGVCSTGHDYVGISATKVNLCSVLHMKTEDIGSGDPDDGTKSKLMGIFATHTDGKGYMMFDDVPHRPNHLRVFIDLSSFTGSKRELAYAEDLIYSTFNREFRSSDPHINKNALDFATPSGGNGSDGKILIELTK